METEFKTCATCVVPEACSKVGYCPTAVERVIRLHLDTPQWERESRTGGRDPSVDYSL